MKTKTLLCTLVVLLTAFATAQPALDLQPDRTVAGHILPPHLRMGNDFMRRMHDRKVGSSLSTHANTKPSKVNGLIQWQQSLGGTNSDVAYSIQQTSDGGYIVAGDSYSNDGDVSGHHGNYPSDYWIVKLSSTGTIQWQNSLGGSSYDYARSIQQTNEGGYIVAGYSESYGGDVSGHHGGYDCWIVKLKSTGAIQWQQSLGGTGADIAYSIQQTKDGGYIVAGGSQSNDRDVSGNHGDYDYWIVKLKSTGTILWQQSLGGTGADIAYSIQQTKDGGYIVAGASYSNDGDVSGHHGYSYYADDWVVKLSSTGTIQWQQSLGGTSSDYARSIQQTNEGGYIVAGGSWSNDGDASNNHGYSDYWIVKLSSTGAIQWQNSLGGSSYEGASSIQQTSDGGYIVAGSSESNDGDVSGNHGGYADYWIVKLGRNGNLQVQESIGGSVIENCTSGCITKDYGYIMAGYSYSNDGDVSGNHGDSDYWIVKLKGLKSLLPTADPATSSDKRTVLATEAAKPLLHIQPNPSPTGTFTVDVGTIRNNVLISVTNSSGRQVYAKRLAAARQFSIPLNNQPKGIYYLQISYNGGKQTEKLVVQ